MKPGKQYSDWSWNNVREAVGRAILNSVEREIWRAADIRRAVSDSVNYKVSNIFSMTLMGRQIIDPSIVAYLLAHHEREI